MKRLGIVLLATVGLASLAQAADLPTAKAPAPVAAKPNCWSSFWSWLNTSADDCPIGAYGITVYGTADLGYGYQEWGAPIGSNADKPNYGLQKGSYKHIWQPTINGLSTSVLGVKMKEDILPYGWSLIGVVEAGFNPLSGQLINGPRSLTDVNMLSANGISTVTIKGKSYKLYDTWQPTSFDSSRAGQWGNSQAYIGVSNKTWGTLTYGRTNNLIQDTQSKYDPVASTAFSLIGYSASFAGMGNTEVARLNSALTYKVAIPKVGALDVVRLGAQVQIGGYGMDNPASQAYFGQIGADYGNFSFDGMLGWAKDAVSLSSFGGTWTSCGVGGSGISVSNGAYAGCYDPNSTLKGTLSNNFGAAAMASYKWDRFKFFGGYYYSNQSNPSDSYAGGFSTIANGIFVPTGGVTSTAYLLNNNTLSSPAYPYNRVAQTIWTGVKWSVPDDWMHGWGKLDLATGFYYQWQNDYNFTWTTGKIKGVPYGYATSAACTGTGAFISSSKCAGSQDAISFFADYQPVKRVDIYAGVMITNVYGGMANGFWNYQTYWNPITKTFATSQHAFTQNVDPTIGVRIRF